MIFYGIPNQLVTTIDRIKQIRKPLFRFNNDGRYETDNVKMIAKLKTKFKHEEIKHICKYCEQGFDNKGKYLAHIRIDHKKGETNE